MKRIDLENHFYDKCFIDVLEARNEPPLCTPDHRFIRWTDSIEMPQGNLLSQLMDVADERIKRMQQAGITTAVISCSPGPEQLETRKSIEICKKTNDALFKITKKYPGKYLGSAILPVNDADVACKELERCVKELGFVSWHTHSNYGKNAPDEIRYRPIFKKAAELGVYVYIHPQISNNERIRDYGFTVAGPGLGFTIDTMITLTKMVVTGLFDEVPDIKIVLGHLGEAIPFLMNRIDNRLTFLPNSNIKFKHTLQYYFKHNIMITTSGNISKEAFECARKVVGIDHICFGSDYPYENLDDIMEFLDEVPISQKERKMLFFQNAIERLGITV